MYMMRSRGTQDGVRASQHDPIRVAVPNVDTRRLHSPLAHPSLNAAVRLSQAVAFFCGRRPRRFYLLHWYRWLKKRNLVFSGAVALFLLLFVTMLFISFITITLTWEHPWTQILVREYLSFLEQDDLAVRVPGAMRPREPGRLWAVHVAHAKPLVEPLAPAADAAAQADHTTRLAARLEECYAASLVLYTFANGTERNHVYRRLNLGYCGPYLQSVEIQLALNGAVLDGKGTTETCTTPMRRAKTGVEVLAMVDWRAEASVTGRDHEMDELRHSIRSLEQHVRWHRGRVVIVSPGHHPTWVDGAKNFLAGACGDASVQALRLRGTHLRLTTVHQDALMPYGIRLTVNSHSIEQHIWRVRNITPVHVYMNDDYFVNRDVAITDLFNEYGGTIVRVESTLISDAHTSNDTLPSWSEGVSHTNYVTVEELDLRHEDDVPLAVLQLWQQFSDDGVRQNFSAVKSGAVPLPSFKGPSQQHAMWTLLEMWEPSRPSNVNLPEKVTPVDVLTAYASEVFGTIRPHFFATHAPFVYCTNMLRYFATRYQTEYAQSLFLHHSRSSTDLYVPFMYNAFVMARPWVASPRFPSAVLLQHELEREVATRTEQLCGAKNGTASAAVVTEAEVHRAKLQAAEEVRQTLSVAPIALDNCDGCAPATMLVGGAVNGCLFGRFTEKEGENILFMRQVARKRPMFFNINSGPITPKAANQLRAFLHDKFPTPVFLEKTTAASSTDAEATLRSTFDALMALPVVGVVSYEEGACPLVRSLSLAFAGHHRGRVHVAVQRHGLGEAGEADESLRETRRRLGHRVLSSFSGVRCAFGSLVSVGPANRTEALADVALRALRESGGAGVELPSTCGHSGDNDGAAAAGAGLRVRGFVIDARTPSAPVKSVGALRDALAMPGQTLALEDFRAVRVGPEDRDVVLVLAREDADAKAVHWITGASENDLLVTYPLPVEAYENMTAPLVWALP